MAAEVPERELVEEGEGSFDFLHSTQLSAIEQEKYKGVCGLTYRYSIVAQRSGTQPIAWASERATA